MSEQMKIQIVGQQNAIQKRLLQNVLDALKGLGCEYPIRGYKNSKKFLNSKNMILHPSPNL